MTMSMFWGSVPVRHGRHDLPLACFFRPGKGPAVVYLHGLGSSKLDFAGALDWPALEGRSLLAFDYPGCGGSPDAVETRVGVPELAAAAQQLLDTTGVGDAIIVGHSLGGAVALDLAERLQERLRGVVSVEGNLAEE